MAPIVAHRGGAAYAPENTLAAFAAALTRGDRAFECDLQVTRDGKLVVIHDRLLSRTTNGAGAVAHVNSGRLRRLDAGKWKSKRFKGEHPPRLEDVLDLASGRASVLLELKRGKRIVSRLQRILEERPKQSREVALISFDAELLGQASRRLPDIPRMYLRHKPKLGRFNDHSLRKAKTARASYIGLEDPGIHPRIVCRAHAAGLGVYAFTVDSPKRARQLRDMGVDGLISDATLKVREAFRPPPLSPSHRMEFGPYFDPRFGPSAR